MSISKHGLQFQCASISYILCFAIPLSDLLICDNSLTQKFACVWFAGRGVDGHSKCQRPADGAERPKRQRQHHSGERADGAEARQGVAAGGGHCGTAAARRPQPGGAAGARPGTAVRLLAAQLWQRDARFGGLPGVERGRVARGRGQSAKQHCLQVVVAAVVCHRGRQRY